MRILLLHDYGTLVGGAERSVLTLRDGLRSRGHEVRLMTADRVRAGEGIQHADVTCRGAQHDRVATMVRVANPSAHRTLRRELDEFRPDVVHIRMMMTQLSPLVLRLLRDVPTVHHVSWYRVVCPRGTKLLPDGSPCTVKAGVACLRNRCVTPLSWPFDMAQMALHRKWRANIDATVALSSTVERHLTDAALGPVTLIENAVSERPARPSLGGPPRLCFAGRVVAEKGLDVLIDALARSERSDLVLDVVGDGPESGAARALARRIGVDERIEWHGHLHGEALERVLDRAWVQVVPHTWDEPFGNVVTEAMARGTAVIASDAGGPSEIIDHDITGLLVPPGDAAALASAIDALVADVARCEAIGAAARAVARQRFSVERLLDDCEDLYRRISTPADGDSP